MIQSVKPQVMLSRLGNALLLAQPFLTFPVFLSVLQGVPPLWLGWTIAIIPLPLRFCITRRLTCRTPFDIPILIPNLFVLTSARRIKEYGLLCTYSNYIINYFSVLFYHKPLPQRLENVPLKLSRIILNRLHPSYVYSRLVSHCNHRCKQIALTFDDGPNEPFTSQILDILRQHDIRATFFMLGQNATRFTNVCQRIRKEGHIIGNYSYSHSRWLALKGGQKITQELELAQEAIYKSSGVKPNLFRPPYGFWSPWMLRTAKKLGFTVITWDNMTNDWESTKEADGISHAILRRTKPGGIIVLHDGRDTRQSYDRTPLLQALPIIIASLKRQGYQFVTVPQLISE